MHWGTAFQPVPSCGLSCAPFVTIPVCAHPACCLLSITDSQAHCHPCPAVVPGDLEVHVGELLVTLASQSLTLVPSMFCLPTPWAADCDQSSPPSCLLSQATGRPWSPGPTLSVLLCVPTRVGAWHGENCSQLWPPCPPTLEPGLFPSPCGSDAAPVRTLPHFSLG